MTITRHKKSRFWAVKEADGALICVCVYRKGAVNVIRRLRRLPSAVSPTGRCRHECRTRHPAVASPV